MLTVAVFSRRVVTHHHQGTEAAQHFHLKADHRAAVKAPIGKLLLRQGLAFAVEIGKGADHGIMGHPHLPKAV